jgi:hypothetical protein
MLIVGFKLNGRTYYLVAKHQNYSHFPFTIVIGREHQHCYVLHNEGTIATILLRWDFIPIHCLFELLTLFFKPFNRMEHTALYTYSLYGCFCIPHARKGRKENEKFINKY